MKMTASVGIVSYGVYLPAFFISSEEIALGQGVSVGVAAGLGVLSKTVAPSDQDAITLAAAAGQQALKRWQGNLTAIQALFVGSESHPYAVKATGTVVAQALGLLPSINVADLQFACRAGTQAMLAGCAYVVSGMASAAMAIGADTAQAKSGDILEFTAAAGAAALVIGRKKLLARLIATSSYTTDTPDFWRRSLQPYPEHTGRFTGEPAYFHHVMMATKQLLDNVQLKPSDIDYCVFHTPNAKFPQEVMRRLGFTAAQLQPSLVVTQVGNTYAAASFLALAAVLDQATANQTILLTSYGSGGGADCILLKTTTELLKQRQVWRQQHLDYPVQDHVSHATPLTYLTYQQYQHARQG